MKKLALIIIAPFLVSACTAGGDHARMGFMDAYISCQQIAEEFANIRHIRAGTVPEKAKGSNRSAKYRNHPVVKAANNLNQRVTPALRRVKNVDKIIAADKREPLLYKLAEIRDCNFSQNAANLRPMPKPF